VKHDHGLAAGGHRPLQVEQRMILLQSTFIEIRGSDRSDCWLIEALLGFCRHWLPEFNLVPIGIIDPGEATVGLIHPFGIDLYSLQF
jgi:hypothetical protein